MGTISLNLDNVSKSFASADTNNITHALSDITLRVKDGEFLSIVGPSGCGKSTILRLVAGLIVPTTGSLTLNGEAIREPDPKRGMVFQKPTLFPWLTVEQNVAFSLRMLKKEENGAVDRLIQMIGLSEFRHAYPHQLSGGMAQRVALIRTMINEPDVFLLDEPLGALDAFTRMNMQDELINMWNEKKEQKTCFFITHDVDEAIYMGTRILVMAPRPGRVVDDIPIEMDYPRNRTSRQFLTYRKKIMEMLDFGRAE